MTEEEAHAWLAARFSPERRNMVARYVEMLRAENRAQNLISKASEATIWSRHIVDSAQLLEFAPGASNWLDVGSGPGLPGVVLACLSDASIALVEPRARRVAFLREVVEQLGLANATVHPCVVERMADGCYDAVTARAYASLPEIFASTVRLTDSSTIWVLPKGRSAETELEAARDTWQGVFHVEQSATDAEARIVVARQVRRVKR